MSDIGGSSYESPLSFGAGDSRADGFISDSFRCITRYSASPVPPAAPCSRSTFYCGLEYRMSMACSLSSLISLCMLSDSDLRNSYFSGSTISLASDSLGGAGEIPGLAVLMSLLRLTCTWIAGACSCCCTCGFNCLSFSTGWYFCYYGSYGIEAFWNTYWFWFGCIDCNGSYIL